MTNKKTTGITLSYPTRPKCLLASLMVGGALLAAPNMMFASVTHVTETQQQTVKGRVVDSNGDPVIGAVVTVKGTKIAAITDVDGNYTIAASPSQTLIIKSIGMQTQELPASQANTVTLSEDATTLGETVVIGYGTVKKADLAGSVSVMNDKAFRDQPVTTVSDALQGRMAGINVVSSGVPGGDVKIRVRGVSSVSRNNSPLYVVDGIVRESGLEGLNPEDIQSIQVLKDASSTAIYGSRGANGVVLIQTKSGRSGDARITFDASLGVSNAYSIPEAMDAKTYAQALLDGGKITNRSEVAAYLDGTNPGINWKDEIYRTGIVQNYKVVFTQGNDKTQYYISGNYMQNKGVVQATSYERYQAKMNVHSQLKPWFDITADMQYSHGKGKGTGFGMSGYNPLWVAYSYSPTMEMFDANGNYNKDPYNSIQSNPLGILEGGDSQRRRDIFTGHVDLKFKILPGLTFTSTNGVDYYDGKGYSFGSKRVDGKNSMGNNDSQRTLWQSTNNLTYAGQWDKHGLTATAVYEATSSSTRSMGLSGTGLLTESVGWWDANMATSKSVSNGYSKWTMESWVGRLMYNYDEKYYLTATFRADGSSRFTNKKWGTFPSVAAAWNVTREDFMKDVKWLSNLKVRASYGVIGNQDIDPYSTLGLMSQTTFDFGTATKYTGYWANAIATPDLTWEKTHQFDLGLDLGFFNNRLEVTIDYYNKKTKDGLLQRSQPSYLGGASYWVNAGEVSNKGIDIAVTGRIIESKDLNWTTTVNGSYLKNKVTKLTAQDPILYGDAPVKGTIDPVTIIKEGEAIGTFYGYRWAGLNADGLDSYYKADGTVTTSPTSEDRAVLGHALPNFTLGWNNTISWKNFEFNAFFNGAFGAKRLNAVRFAMNTMAGASKFVTDKDYISNIGKTMPALNAEGNNNLGNSDKWIEKADYFRCENLSVAYNLPKSLLKFADIRLSVSAQNLFTITGYKGTDPAGTSFAGNVDRDNGIDTGTYPNPRTITFGARFTF